LLRILVDNRMEEAIQMIDRCISDEQARPQAEEIFGRGRRYFDSPFGIDNGHGIGQSAEGFIGCFPGTGQSGLITPV